MRGYATGQGVVIYVPRMAVPPSRSRGFRLRNAPSLPGTARLSPSATTSSSESPIRNGWDSDSSDDAPTASPYRIPTPAPWTLPPRHRQIRQGNVGRFNPIIPTHVAHEASDGCPHSFLCLFWHTEWIRKMDFSSNRKDRFCCALSFVGNRNCYLRIKVSVYKKKAKNDNCFLLVHWSPIKCTCSCT